MVNVQLLVYDLSRGMASSMSQAILGQRIDGIWHTGVFVFNKEYYYGGGIQITPLGVFSQSNQMYPVQTLSIGETTKTKEELDAFLRSIHSRFTAMTYNLITNNCNNFANEVCIFLTGNGIPSYIIDLPNIVFSTPGGAMLRPMIENMQNAAYQQQEGNSFDPFGHQQQNYMPTPQTTSLSDDARFEANLSDAIRASMLQNNAVKKVKLDEEPMTSNDSSSLKVLANKIFQLPGQDGVKGSALTDPQKVTLNILIDTIVTKKKQDPVYNKETYQLLHGLVEEHPSAHLSLFYLLRLVTLNEFVTFEDIPTIPWVIKKLCYEPQSFTSMPALTMALCFLLNILSHSNGVAFIFKNFEGLASPLLDTAMAFLTHERPDIRQISSAIAYNFTLANTKSDKLSGLWVEAGVADLHPTAVQLLLSSVEGVGEETDVIVRKRRLSIACRIIRAYGLHAGHLGRDLGFVESLKSLQNKINTDKPEGHQFEEDALVELSVAFT